jgi:hypothetical protein
LIDLQTTDFQNAPIAGVQILKGADPVPAPCAPGGQIGCRHHLDGTGHFSIAPDDPHHPQFTGAIANGAFTTTAGDFALQLSLGVDPVLDLPLTDAHLKFLSSTATTIGSADATKAGAVVAGAIRASDMPAFLVQFTVAAQALIARDCTGVVSVAPSCGCTVSSGGYSMLNFFDTDHNCNVTLAEVMNNPMLSAILTPDVTLPDNTMAVSVGFGIHAVPATFTLP